MVHHRGHRRGADHRAADADAEILTGSDEPGPGSGSPGAGRVRRSYDRLAARYDARWEAYVDASVRETLSRMELPERGRLLDAGCGTGVLLERVARDHPGLELVGLDLSPGMIRRAGDRLDKRAGGSRPGSRHAPTHLVTGSAELLPFPEGTFDLAVSTSVLHFWRDPAGALAELRRALRPGGRLVLTDWCREGWIMRLRDLRFRLTDPAHFRTLAPDELVRLLEGGGWAIERLDRYEVPGRWRMMTAVAHVGAGGPS